MSITAAEDTEASANRPLAPPTAYFSYIPASHNGAGELTLRVSFSEEVSLTATTLQDHVLVATGATVTAVAQRTANSTKTWNVTVQPGGNADVTVGLAATTACDQPGAVCTSDGRHLHNQPHVTVPGHAIAQLSDLTVTGLSLSPAFSPAEILYTAQAYTGLTEVTVTAIAPRDDITVEIAPEDADTTTTGHQVALEPGVPMTMTVTVTVTVTSSDGNASRRYQVTATRAAVTCANSTPTHVTFDALPIVVNSTTDDYFVLYVTHDVDGTVQEMPVLVKLGEAGTTTLAESAPARPVERYRVEKYQVADPADVDGDCVDDLTELAALGAMNPVNPAATVAPEVGSVAYLATSSRSAKFVVYGLDLPLRPSLVFQNRATYEGHDSFMRAVLGLDPFAAGTVKGIVAYDDAVASPDGSPGAYVFWMTGYGYHCSYIDRAYTMLVASMPMLEKNLVYWMATSDISEYRRCSSLFSESRIPLTQSRWGETGYFALNPAIGFGLLRERDADERPHPREVVIYEALPNELPRVAGIISTVPQTPLSHVNLRAVQNRIPNAYIRDALNEPDITDLIGSYVRYEVIDPEYSIRQATKAEVDAHYASSRPARAHTPQRDLSVTSITALSDVGFDDWDAFGVKAANLAVLGSLGFPEGTVPDGFAIPFYFYDEFMKANGLYDHITEMLADQDFQTDLETQQDDLKDLRKAIKDADSPQWIIDALTEMHAQFPVGTSLRYRSSTNNEDLPRFNGAGLYDSKTQDPDETEEDGIDKSLKGVFASLWNFRAFTERDFQRIDHTAAAMGVLVHPNFSDELANGVAVSFDPTSGRYDKYYANTQIGEDLVTNPEAHSVPEELLLKLGEPGTVATEGDPGYAEPASGIDVIALSNLVEPGEIIMSDDQIAQLRQHLETIHAHFEALYNPAPGEDFAMEIEYKITSEDVLSIKQARPWVFAVGPPLAAHFAAFPDAHDGSTRFTLQLNFIGTVETDGAALADALVVTGGAVTAVRAQGGSSPLSWEITVRPDGTSGVTVALVGGIACSLPGAICTAGGVQLHNSPEVYVPGPPPDAATLATLAVEGADLAPAFAADTFAYTAEVDHGVSVVTASATAADAGASAVVAPSDSDANTPGHQIALVEGDNTVTVTVTGSDGATLVYTVTNHPGTRPAGRHRRVAVPRRRHPHSRVRSQHRHIRGRRGSRRRAGHRRVRHDPGISHRGGRSRRQRCQHAGPSDRDHAGPQHDHRQRHRC